MMKTLRTASQRPASILTIRCGGYRFIWVTTRTFAPAPPTLTNAPSGGMAGSITAALFLKRFVTATKKWVHFDIYGWSLSERPHTSVGGEAQAIRALFHYISRSFATK